MNIINNHIAYVIFDLNELNEYQLDGKKAREFVNEMGNIKEFEIWAIFNERIDANNNIIYDGSIRSKYVPINVIASKYNGGGHANASGVKGLSKSDLKNILIDFKQALNII